MEHLKKPNPYKGLLREQYKKVQGEYEKFDRGYLDEGIIYWAGREKEEIYEEYRVARESMVHLAKWSDVVEGNIERPFLRRLRTSNGRRDAERKAKKGKR